MEEQGVGGSGDMRELRTWFPGEVGRSKVRLTGIFMEEVGLQTPSYPAPSQMEYET